MAVNCRSVVPPGTLPLWFEVKGIEPKSDPAWKAADKARRLEFWTIAGRIAQEVKQREIQAGLDYAGRKLKPVKPRKARYASGARLDGEPLTPHRALSRTRRLLRYMVKQSGGLTMYWANGWGKILDYHRRGVCLKRGGRVIGRLPVRNVFGISPKGRKEIAERALASWKSGNKAKPANHFLTAPNGLAIDLPVDPEFGLGLDRERFLSEGVRLVRYAAGTRTVNPGTGIAGVATPNVRVMIDWNKRRGFAR